MCAIWDNRWICGPGNANGGGGCLTAATVCTIAPKKKARRELPPRFLLELTPSNRFSQNVIIYGTDGQRSQITPMHTTHRTCDRKATQLMCERRFNSTLGRDLTHTCPP